MKKFKFVFKKIYYVLFALVLACTLPTLVVGVLRLAGVMTSLSLVLDIVTLIFALLIALLAFSILRSYYVFKEECLALYFGFFRQSIPYNSLSAIRKYDDALWLDFTSDKGKRMLTVINIKEDEQDEFVAEIRLHNANVIYTVEASDGEDK